MKKTIFSAMVALGITIAFIVVIYDITDSSKSKYQHTDLKQLTAQNEMITIDDEAED